MNCELYFRIIPEFNFRIVHLGQRIESRNSWAVRTFSHASCFFQRNVKTWGLVSAKLTSLRNGIGFSEIMLFSLISIQLPGIWMNSLSNLTAMKCKPFLISDLFCSSDSDKRVETRHASLKSFEENNCSRTVRALCSRGFTETFAEKNRSGVVPLCWRGSTFCSAEIWNSLERFVQLEFISRRISTQQTSSLHLYWQLIFAPKHKKNSSLLTSSKAQLKYCCNQKHIWYRLLMIILHLIIYNRL